MITQCKHIIGMFQDTDRNVDLVSKRPDRKMGLFTAFNHCPKCGAMVIEELNQPTNQPTENKL